MSKAQCRQIERLERRVDNMQLQLNAQLNALELINITTKNLEKMSKLNRESIDLVGKLVSTVAISGALISSDDEVVP